MRTAFEMSSWKLGEEYYHQPCEIDKTQTGHSKIDTQIALCVFLIEQQVNAWSPELRDSNVWTSL